MAPRHSLDRSRAANCAIELAPSGPVTAPPTTRRSLPVRSSPRRTRATGPTHVYECGYCGKRFYRKTRAPRLNKHKDNNGYPCPGRTAYYVDTRY